jgi:sec-independent protein translocase protein TatC
MSSFTDQEERLLEGEGGKSMPLFAHLDELRHRLIISAIAVVIFFCVSIFFATDILTFLRRPLDHCLGAQAGASALYFTGPLDVFLAGVKVAVLTAIVFAAPVWIYQFWKFVEPALYAKEKRLVKPFALASVALFLGGITFGYSLIVPMTLGFLLDFGKEVGTPIITINDYLSMLLLMIFAFGFIFEVPLILVLLGTLDLVDVAFLKKNRRIVAVIILILAAFLTPPDPMSQIAMALPLYVMYEVAILVISWIKRPTRA